MKSIDLFAGCGGLSLGLEMAGFETVFVNELHEDTMQTFLIKRPNSKLSEKANHVNDIFSLTKNPKDLAAFKTRIQKEHGYLWKIAPEDFGLLFPPKRVFDLASISAA